MAKMNEFQKWAGLGLALKASCTDHANKVLRGNREMVRAHYRRHGYDLPSEESEDEMHVGDIYSVPQSGGSIEMVKKLGVAAALMLGGASLPLGAWAVYQAAKPQPSTAAPATDNDTQFELVIPEE